MTATAAEQGNSLAYKSLEQLSELTEIGLSGLAMRMIEHQQRQYPEFSPEWYAFEFEYFKTLSALERWRDIIDRADQLLARAKQRTADHTKDHAMDRIATSDRLAATG